MKILPVLDLLHGVVVRGVAGQRDEYRPVSSSLTKSAEPLAVARAFRERLGLDELYVADLDAIQGGTPNWAVYQNLFHEGFHLMIDAGGRDVDSARRVLEFGDVVAALETSPGPQLLQTLCREFGPARVVFSLDSKAGQPMGDLALWQSSTALEIARTAVAAGIVRIIVLDLADVGVGRGVGSADLCQQLLQQFPHLELITGGGVRNVDDLIMLQSTGVAAVLVASALHNGAIGAEEIKRLSFADLS